jgi:hypothetical protein
MRSTEEILLELLEALTRQGTDLDGNWGNPPVRVTFANLYDELKRKLPQHGGDSR